MAAVSLLVLCCGLALGQNAHLAYLPMTFHTETEAIRTTACFQVTERVYSQSAWWESPSQSANGGPEAAFKAVIAAIKRKDRPALLKLSDATQTKDANKFDQQASAYFQQLAVIELAEVPRAYEFDGLAVFFAKLQPAGGKAFFAPFVFAYEGGGGLGFLPSRTQMLTFRLTEDWFNSMWGPSATDHPAYCTDADIKRANYSISLASFSGTQKPAGQPSRLFLTGAPLGAPGRLANLATRVKAAMDGLKSALVSPGIDNFVKHMTPEGGNRLKQWFTSADEAERKKYIEAIREQQPFFLFDASPLVVVYAKSPSGAVQVMYLTNAGNELLWTNSSQSTVADQVFKQGPLYGAALTDKDKPFSSIMIK